ncbi:MAG: histidine kinase internal region [Anaerocolumna sp.]|nr:histidine kinase internal region [Anaerocolumna sp.]
MKFFKRHFSVLKLSHKFTFLIMAIIVLPLVILSIFFFNNIRDSRIKEKIKSVEINFTQNYEQIQKNVEMCQMSTQVMLNSQNFWNYVERFSTDEKIPTKELLEFYKSEIKALEKIVNTNPYLYQIRVYADYKGLPEMMPILYKMHRVKRLAWAKNGIPESGTWQFDYEDEIFPFFSTSRDQHLVSLVTYKPLANEKLALIEVSTRMELLFPNLYSGEDNEWTCFASDNGKYYFDMEQENRWLDNIDEILLHRPDNLGNTSYVQMSLDGEPVIVCFKTVKEIKGTLFRVVSLKEDYAAITKTSNVFWGCFFIIVIILLFFSDKMVKIILKQFYEIMNTIHKVQKGNLDVRVNVTNPDEIGELGQQINKMLERITHLMEDSIKREILVKDSEIRALQNQINAHFIYNVLESIKMMAEIDEKYEISDAVTALGKLLRYSMKWVSKNVTVAEEIDYIKNYLALINLRFDYEIYLSLNMPDQIYELEIPKMSLQPIIENAIYHGIEELAEDTSIYMKGILYEDYCIIEITDSGRGMSDEEIDRLQKKIQGEIETTGSSGNGIGLKNVQDRIKISFGNDYGISIASKKDCYTKVMVKIPLV